MSEKRFCVVCQNKLSEPDSNGIRVCAESKGCGLVYKGTNAGIKREQIEGQCAFYAQRGPSS